MLDQAIVDLNDCKYKDVKSLQLIIANFEKLPRSVQFDHFRDIEKINMMINNLNHSEELLHGQIASLVSLLRSFERPVKLNDYQPKEIKTMEVTNTSEILKKFSKERKVGIYHNVFSITYEKKVENIEMDVCVNKFEQNDIATQTLQQLFLNLTRNILLSDITNYLEEYFVILDGLLLENEFKYRTFYNDIITALEMEDYHRGHGFQRQPDQNNIVERLSLIEKFYCSS